MTTPSDAGRAGEREAGHDARCEREYTPNGYIFIDCRCHLTTTPTDPEATL